MRRGGAYLMYLMINGLKKLLPCHVWQPWTPRRRTDRRWRRRTINGLTEHIQRLMSYPAMCGKCGLQGEGQTGGGGDGQLTINGLTEHIQQLTA